MKKIIAVIFAVAIAVSLAVPAFALTPKIEIPNVPEIPDISDNVTIKLPDSFWSGWFKDHPIKIDLSHLFG
jgi:hypothetical protein